MTTKFYKKYLITKGLCGYNENGEQETVLLEKPTIDKAIDTIKLKPVYIGHDSKEQVGEVVDLYFDVNSANFICGFNVWDEKAQNLLDNQDYSISSTYQILEKEEMKEDKYHNMDYEYEVKDLEFMNIAIVKEPRYQEAKIMLNSIDNDVKENGGPGSGNFGHAGRPGKRGGSSSYGSRTLEDLNNLANRFKEMKKEGSKKFKETLKRKIQERLMNNDDLRKRWEEYKLERIESKQKEVKEIGNIERKEKQDKESIDIEKGDKAPIQETSNRKDKIKELTDKIKKLKEANTIDGYEEQKDLEKEKKQLQFEQDAEDLQNIAKTNPTTLRQTDEKKLINMIKTTINNYGFSDYQEKKDVLSKVYKDLPLDFYQNKLNKIIEENVDKEDLKEVSNVNEIQTILEKKKDKETNIPTFRMGYDFNIYNGLQDKMGDEAQKTFIEQFNNYVKQQKSPETKKEDNKGNYNFTMEELEKEANERKLKRYQDYLEFRKKYEQDNTHSQAEFDLYRSGEKKLKRIDEELKTNPNLSDIEKAKLFNMFETEYKKTKQDTQKIEERKQKREDKYQEQQEKIKSGDYSPSNFGLKRLPGTKQIEEQLGTGAVYKPNATFWKEYAHNKEKIKEKYIVKKTFDGNWVIMEKTNE